LPWKGIWPVVFGLEALQSSEWLSREHVVWFGEESKVGLFVLVDMARQHLVGIIGKRDHGV
jgi:hypothetical protein